MEDIDDPQLEIQVPCRPDSINDQTSRRFITVEQLLLKSLVCVHDSRRGGGGGGRGPEPSIHMRKGQADTCCFGSADCISCDGHPLSAPARRRQLQGAEDDSTTGNGSSARF
ncbi:unnamed protein product [Heligmosomoides polygyrus]|uniref:Uncharacterized protein n=1 Tax=Heligmosomoides polygyrus TaxID=6339 RepID=A0A3P7U879_HELPZ|nr:unnamed protein product [Heligmosomoides polygyrus]